MQLSHSLRSRTYAVVALAATSCIVGHAAPAASRRAPAPFGSAPVFEHVGKAAVRNWIYNVTKHGENAFRSLRTPRYRSAQQWQGEIQYSIMVDRFRNGDPSNDNLNLPRMQREQQFTGDLHDIFDYRAGGDLQGVIDRLEYLSQLGITSLWLSPIHYNSGGEAHGYCVSNPLMIDPGFGTQEDLQRLVALAHARNMSVVLDVVINHICDLDTRYSRAPDHYECANNLNAAHWAGSNGTDAYGRGTLSFGRDFFGPLRSQHFYSRCGANSYEDTAGEGPAAVFGDFVTTMLDFYTNNWDFQEIFTDLWKYWIAYADVDGFRLDAAKHVTEDFIAYFSTEVREYAQRLGKDNFYVIGEVAASPAWQVSRLGAMESNLRNPDERGSNVPQSLTTRLWTLLERYSRHQRQPYPGLTAVYDFASSGQATSILKGMLSPSVMEGYRNGAWSEIDRQNDMTLGWQHLEIHDWPRFLRWNAQDADLGQLGLAFTLLMDGQPVIYYGQEQGFAGTCDTADASRFNVGQGRAKVQHECWDDVSHANARQTMFEESGWRLRSAEPAVDALRYVGPWRADPNPAPYNWKNDLFLNTDHGTFQTAARLTRLRRSCKALRLGRMYPRLFDQHPLGLMAFSRVYEEQEVLVVFNLGHSLVHVPQIRLDAALQSGNVFGAYRNVLNGFETGRVGFEGDSAFLYFDAGTSFQPRSVSVWVLDRAAGPYRPELGLHLCA